MWIRACPIPGPSCRVGESPTTGHCQVECLKGEGGGSAIYGIYRYVPLLKVWFSMSLLWDRVYRSERLGQE